MAAAPEAKTSGKRRRWSVDRNLLYRYRTYDGENQSWSDWNDVQRPSSSTLDGSSEYNNNEDDNNKIKDTPTISLQIPCPRGSIVVYPNVMDATDRNLLRQELADCNYFRAYQIQGGKEPRRHFLAHERATCDDDFDNENMLQPGYRYNHNNATCLKARSLSSLPRLRQLSNRMKRYCSISEWTIGVNPVIYRNYSDSISPHADDNQHETLILAVVVHQHDGVNEQGDCGEIELACEQDKDSQHQPDANTVISSANDTEASQCENVESSACKAADSNSEHDITAAAAERDKQHPTDNLYGKDAGPAIKSSVIGSKSVETVDALGNSDMVAASDASTRLTQQQNRIVSSATTTVTAINSNESISSSSSTNEASPLDARRRHNNGNFGARQPRRQRVVKIEPQNTNDLVHGDVLVELFLKAGDAYAMDGELQKHYFHSVPKIVHPSNETKVANVDIAAANSAATSDEQQQPPEQQDTHNLRIAVIFRCGDSIQVARDSGVPSDWSPKPPLMRQFGRSIPGLTEGELYTKSQLLHMGAHEGLQKGVSGSRQHGCNAIAVSGLRLDGKGFDNNFAKMQWYVEWSNGGSAMWATALKGLPIRVFRSTDLNSVWRAHSTVKVSVKSFRYDGLYMIKEVGYEGSLLDNGIVWGTLGPESQMPLHLHRKTVCTFRMQRAEWGSGPMENQFSDQELVIKCLRSKNLSLPTKYCPCFCSESQYCELLKTHSDVDLCDIFLYTWGLTHWLNRRKGINGRENVQDRGAFVQSILEQYQMAPRKLHWSALQRKEQAERKLNLVPVIRVRSFAPPNMEALADTLSAMMITKKRKKPPTLRTVSPDASVVSKRTHHVKKRQRCSKLIATPGEQVAAKLPERVKDGSGMEWILAVVTRYDAATDTYTVLDASQNKKNKTNNKPCCLEWSRVKRLSKDPLQIGDHCLAVYPDTTVFYKAKVVSRRRHFADLGPNFQILKFEGEEDYDERGRVMHYQVLNQYVLACPVEPDVSESATPLLSDITTSWATDKVTGTPVIMPSAAKSMRNSTSKLLKNAPSPPDTDNIFDNKTFVVDTRQSPNAPLFAASHYTLSINGSVASMPTSRALHTSTKQQPAHMTYKLERLDL
ncbi:hypothetical protein MPSEU_000327200 [Mayamaea pseudoterrestris]|nr:hypothetical protein MPSEU_000327200 [Mayamaea pseudoterrestris]